jgi:hypothetical protein
MNIARAKFPFPIGSQVQSRRDLKSVMLGFAAALIMAGTLRAGTIYVPNGSFETPATTNVDIRIDSWQDQPQPSSFDPAQFGGEPWNTLMGRFANTAPGSFDYLYNMDGTQAAFIFTYPGA